MIISKQIHVRVYGYLLSGPRACYRYSVSAAPKTDAEAKRIAGDFGALIDWHVCEETVEYEKNCRIDSFKTLRGWRNGFSNRRYDRAVNG